jgi:hypothetical protein
MKQLLLALQREYESKILEADYQIKHYASHNLAINDHSNILKEIDKWVDRKAFYEGKLKQIITYMPKEDKKEKKDGK